MLFFNAEQSLPKPVRARVHCMGNIPHPPSASNISLEIQTFKWKNQDVIITTLYMAFAIKLEISYNNW